jgi:hypoxanthine phosphoribosyltransferase
MPELIPVLTKENIDQMVAQVAREISSDYQNHELILIGVLKGAFVFLTDLIRHLSISVKIDFIRVSSYGPDTSSSGHINLMKGIEVEVKNRHVLVIEDIVDTGLTLIYIIDYIKSLNPKTVKVCTLLDKYERREADIKIDYACHVVDEGFLVGYGLDYDEDYRDLPDIYKLKL